MDWFLFGVQWLHVLLGIFWFGNALAVAAFLIPAVSTLPIPTQRQVGGRYADIAERTFNVVAPAVIVLGNPSWHPTWPDQVAGCTRDDLRHHVADRPRSLRWRRSCGDAM